ncbi:hypothetical protein BY458DRAFT_556637 [Sporodiniella umbellata]|nr:hypothetical protein BY458DRAFT_556637 [Sporodiniella umbellata]
MWSCFWYVGRLYGGVQHSEVKKAFHTGVFYLATAILIWLFDKNLCYLYEFLPNPQLHAWWHVLPRATKCSRLRKL